MPLELNTNVFLLNTVRFKMITPSLITLLVVLSQAGEIFGCVSVITGAAYETYNPKGYHGQGYAWDIRTKDIEDAFGYAAYILKELKSISKRYRIVYGNKTHTDHIHVEYRYDIAE